MSTQKKLSSLELEQPAFPAEFLDTFVETAGRALHDYLASIHASKEAINLLDAALTLKGLERDIETVGQIQHGTNELIVETVADASRCIVALGGVFYAPSGTSVRRVECVP